MFVPPDVVHTFRNDAGAAARFLNFHAPSGGFAELLRGDGTDSTASTRLPTGVVRRRARSSPPPVRASGSSGRTASITIKGELPEISAFELEVEPAWAGIGVHDHADQVDTFFVLEGEAEPVLGDEAVHAGAGSFYAALPGTRHGMRSPHGHVAFLNVHAPDAGFAESVRRQ